MGVKGLIASVVAPTAAAAVVVTVVAEGVPSPMVIATLAPSASCSGLMARVVTAVPAPRPAVRFVPPTDGMTCESLVTPAREPSTATDSWVSPRAASRKTTAVTSVPLELTSVSAVPAKIAWSSPGTWTIANAPACVAPTPLARFTAEAAS